MKNLDERLQQIKQQTTKDVIEVRNENPLSFINPTELVPLPSRGKFYAEGHPLKDAETVEIRQMTAREEDILTNKSLIKKGIVIDRLIESLLVDKSIPVQTLLVGDKNAIMVAARISAYGPNYNVIVACNECAEKNNLMVDLEKVNYHEAPTILQQSEQNNFVNSERLLTGNILIQLPKTGWVVECKLLTGADEQKILELLESKKKIDPNSEITISEQLKTIVKSINTVDDPNLVYKAIDLMPAFDAKHLRKIYQTMIPNIRIEQKYSCSSCGEEQEVEVPFTQEFFWPK